MRAFCTICSDLFDDVNAILAAPCGHSFHSTCLMQWMEHSKTCPECRKQVTNRSAIRLYFSISSDEHVVNNNTLENEIQSLKAELCSKDRDIDTFKKAKDEYRFYISKAEKEAEDLRQANFVLKSEIAEINLKLKSLSRLEPKIHKLEQRNSALCRNLEHYNNVQLIISGTQSDVDDILKCSGSGPEATKQLATYCSMLKRELQQVIDSKQKLRGEVTLLKKDMGFNTCELKRLREENKVLKEQLVHVEKENIALLKRPMGPVSTNVTPKTTITYESPAPERQKNQDTEFGITPISKLGPLHKRSKIDIVVFDKGYTSVKPQSSTLLTSNPQINHLKFASGLLKEENSIIRTGYNGFGGHSNFIARSTQVKRKTSKLKPF